MSWNKAEKSIFQNILFVTRELKHSSIHIKAITSRECWPEAVNSSRTSITEVKVVTTRPQRTLLPAAIAAPIISNTKAIKPERIIPGWPHLGLTYVFESRPVMNLQGCSDRRGDGKAKEMQ